MNERGNQPFIEQLSELSSNHDVSHVWPYLEQGITAAANVIYQKHCQGSQPLSPYRAWWQACCELLNARQVVIRGVVIDHSTDQRHEYIDVCNTGLLIVDLSGWQLKSANGIHQLIFGHKTYIAANESIRIYSVARGEFNFNSTVSIWDHNGDQALLYDRNGTMISAWAYGNKAHSKVYVSHIALNDERHNGKNNEYAQISNNSDCWVDLAGWQLTTSHPHGFVFPPHSALQPKSSIRVYSNCIDNKTGGYSFGSQQAIWDSNGDIAVLNDNQGKEVSTYRYGDAV